MTTLELEWFQELAKTAYQEGLSDGIATKPPLGVTTEEAAKVWCDEMWEQCETYREFRLLLHEISN